MVVTGGLQGSLWISALAGISISSATIVHGQAAKGTVGGRHKVWVGQGKGEGKAGHGINRGAPVGWGEGVVAMGQHVGSKITHDRFGLDIQIIQHGVGVPAAQQLDDVAINMGAEKGRGTRGLQGAGRDVPREEASGGPSSVVASWRVWVIWVWVRGVGPVGRKVVARGVWLGAWWCWRWRTWLVRAMVGQK